ncbi:MAG: hypothetical protein PHY93_16790 [Bacteriovorax sp.]|nr:hypothetical protein [Bacteriovorax sp.]
MKFKLALFLLLISFYQSAFGIDVGDGSDGTCAVTGPATTLITLARRNYQCTTLDIDGNLPIFKGVGGAAVIIKVQGNVTMMNAAHTLDISGADGGNGGAAIQNGGIGGAGGNTGGNSNFSNGLIGSGVRAGSGGLFVTNVGLDSFGGGGGGGSYNTKAVVEPIDGDNFAGGGVGSKGANGDFFGNETTFETTFAGGSGGGAGGGGFNGGSAVTGSSGGGSGGALRIIAGGNITIDGTIRSNGGTGGGLAGTLGSGGGGGGSGGAIWLQAVGAITGTGTIEALGGSHGINDSLIFSGGFPTIGYGGDGSKGRIRLDDNSNGSVVLGSILPPSQGGITFTPTAISSSSSAISRQYASAIACGRVSIKHEMPWNNLINLLLGIMITSLIYFSISRKGKI